MRTDRDARVLTTADEAVDLILETIGRDVRVGMPLGLGKPNHLCNALYARAKADPTIQLTILTALTLSRPTPGSDMEARFLTPFLDRVFEDWVELDYVADMKARRVPANITIKEFFYPPGGFVGNAEAQRNYVSSNYTHAARDVFDAGCNVAMQLVAERDVDGEHRLSMSCNPDTGPELIQMLEEAGRPHLVIVQVNDNLPYMVHDAEMPATATDAIVRNPSYVTKLFGPPKQPVGFIDYAIGVHTSALIKDGGTLQVGIGALGDAVVHAMTLRHADNAFYRTAVDELGTTRGNLNLINEHGGLDPFEEGLYGSTEMFVDGFLHLMDAGILRRRVYDFWALQTLINQGRCDPANLTPDVLDGLEELGVRVIRTKDFDVLQRHGLFRDGCTYELGHIRPPPGPDGKRAKKIVANLGDPKARARLAEECLGTSLRNGIVLHGGFFLGPNDFYDALREMSDEERAAICMTGVYKVNQLDFNPRLYIAQRKDARFVNTGLMVTLNGAVVSDGLENQQVISGVGGQYNFVAMAHHLRSGRSILMVRAARDGRDGPVSNVVFNYGHITIPRHLRDIVVTEYGIALLRGKSDEEIVQALLNVTDSRFQDDLLVRAKAAGKLARDYEIPAVHRQNYPQRLEAVIGRNQTNLRFPAFPFGTELTDLEVTLGGALRRVAARVAGGGRIGPLRQALNAGRPPKEAAPYLERMGLTKAAGAEQWVARRLLADELQKMGALG